MNKKIFSGICAIAFALATSGAAIAAGKEVCKVKAIEDNVLVLICKGKEKKVTTEAVDMFKVGDKVTCKEGKCTKVEKKKPKK